MSIKVESIGNFLKMKREKLSLQLNDVQKFTSINQTILSRIENGKRNPTKSQLLQLGQLYKCDKHDLMVNWLSEKLVSELKKEEFGLEALNAAKEKIFYENNPLTRNYSRYNLESRRYIGSKAKLTNWIIENILIETNGARSFFDVFAGTASIANAASKHFKKIIVNDILFSNNIIYKAFFKDEAYNENKIDKILKSYNSLNTEKLKDNYFSKNFGGKFFDQVTSKLIGYIREDIEKRKKSLSEKEYAVLIATLIYNIDKVANTVGHFDAYIKKPITHRNLFLKPINQNLIPGIEIFQENANFLVKKIQADVAYIDPPYNSRQYSRFYHLYENLVKWDKPILYGVALKPEPENMSIYCTVKAKIAFEDLIQNLNVKHIFVSYNNTYNSKSNSSENKIKLEEIESILKKKGKTKIIECSHRYFNTGKTEFNDHKELLFITKVKNE
jgi:adenine-specific DNA-methyltransferase